MNSRVNGTPLVLKARRRIPWVGALGMFLLFASWFVQNKYSAELAEARRNMDGSMMAITLIAATAEDWTRHYSEVRIRPQPDRAMITAAAFKALQWNLLATKLSADRVDNADWALALASREDKLFLETEEELRKRFKRGDLEALEADLATFIRIDNELQIRARFDSAFARRLTHISNWRTGVDAIVVLLYIMGTSLAIWDFAVRESTPADVSAQQERSTSGAAHRR